MPSAKEQYWIRYPDMLWFGDGAHPVNTQDILPSIAAKLVEN
jgi:hypothetical protein